MFQNLFYPDYQLIINPKLKYIYLHINERGELIVKAPYNSPYQISRLLHKRKTWITKALERFANKKGKLPTFEEESASLYYLGKPYPLEKSHNPLLKRDSFQFKNNTHFLLQYKTFNIEKFIKYINHFYKEEAKKLIPPLVEKQAQIMSVTPQSIKFRKTKRQWGSCSSKNHLSFNTQLIKLPLDVIQYVIVHELAHIRHKHHQESFWNEVKCYLPHYKKLEQELKDYLT